MGYPHKLCEQEGRERPREERVYLTGKLYGKGEKKRKEHICLRAGEWPEIKSIQAAVSLVQ